MIGRWLVSVLVALGCMSADTSAEADAVPWGPLAVVGNHLVTTGNKTVRLLGVQQQGLEYMCLSSPDTLFHGPHDQATIDAWKSWHVNTVRLPINESCWMGGKGVPTAASDYRAAVIAWVRQIRQNGIFVIIDNHVATDGSGPASDILPMADSSAVAMWKSVANTFKSWPGVVYDLYNEPNMISWHCWKYGCWVPAHLSDYNSRGYTAAGMQKMLNAIRGTGSKQPVLVAGNNWSNDNSQWLQWRPNDSANQLLDDQHVYGPSPTNSAAPCDTACRADLTNVAAQYPVVTGELGEVDCAHGYIDDYMAWADAQQIGYLGETWNSVDSGYDCTSPTLLENFNYPDPTPTAYGIGFRTHMQAIDTSPH